MSERYRTDLNQLFLHADISVALRPPATGKLPGWNLKGDICVDSAAALLLAGVEVLGILTLRGQINRSDAVGVLDALSAELDHVLRKR